MTIVRSLGIDSHLNPRAITVSRILQHVRKGRVKNVYSVRSGEAEVIEAEILPSSSVIGKSLKSLDLGEGVRLGAVIRDGEERRLSGELSLKAGDIIVMFVMAPEVKKIEEILYP